MNIEKKVAIIIVNWNGLKFLNDCLSAVYMQTYQNFDVYFVDNGSTDNSLNFIKENFSKVKIVQLKNNTGFAKGNNEGIKEAFKDVDVEYVVCLNNDTIVDKNWLYGLVSSLIFKIKLIWWGAFLFYQVDEFIQSGSQFTEKFM